MTTPLISVPPSHLTFNDSSCEKEFRDHTVTTIQSFFGIQHTLEGDISRSPIKCLSSAYTRLKDTKRHKYSIVSIQTLIRSLLVSIYGCSPLCNKISYDKCITFNQALHSKYIRDTRHTVTQPVHTTFLSRDHHGLYIPFILLAQLQGRARELDVRLNSPDPTQHAPPMVRLSTMSPYPNHYRYLIRDAIISLAQYGLYFRDTDEPSTAISLQQLLYITHLIVPFLDNQSTTSSPPPFTITGNRTG